MSILKKLDRKSVYLGVIIGVFILHSVLSTLNFNCLIYGVNACQIVYTFLLTFSISRLLFKILINLKGEQRGLEKGLEEVKKTKEAIALRLLATGMEADVVADMVDLPLEVVKALLSRRTL